MAVNPCPMSRVALAIGPRCRREYALAQRPVSKSVTGRARNAPLMDHTCGNARVIAYLSAFLFIIVEMSENTLSIDGVAVNEWIARACLIQCLYTIIISVAFHITDWIDLRFGIFYGNFMTIRWSRSDNLMILARIFSAARDSSTVNDTNLKFATYKNVVRMTIK